MRGVIAKGVLWLACLLALSGQSAGGERLRLEIRHSPNCGPCRQLFRDWHDDAEFRGWLQRHFDLHWIKSTNYPLPVFHADGHQDLVGYAGKAKLAAALEKWLGDNSGEPRAKSGEPSQWEPLTDRARNIDKLIRDQVQELQSTTAADRKRLSADCLQRDQTLRAELSEQLRSIDTAQRSQGTQMKAIHHTLGALLAASENTLFQDQSTGAESPHGTRDGGRLPPARPPSSHNAGISGGLSSAASATLGSARDLPTDTVRDHSDNPSVFGRVRSALSTGVPLVLTGLELAGIVTTGAATMGAGGWAVWAVGRLLRRRISRPASPARTLDDDVERVHSQREGEADTSPAPFPRHLDEARELLTLRKSEGRVPVLDCLRGMFLDDQAAHIRDNGTTTEQAVVNQLISDIDKRVNEVAPYSTQPKD